MIPCLHTLCHTPSRPDAPAMTADLVARVTPTGDHPARRVSAARGQDPTADAAAPRGEGVRAAGVHNLLDTLFGLEPSNKRTL